MWRRANCRFSISSGAYMIFARPVSKRRTRSTRWWSKVSLSSTTTWTCLTVSTSSGTSRPVTYCGDALTSRSERAMKPGQHYSIRSIIAVEFLTNCNQIQIHILMRSMKTQYLQYQIHVILMIVKEFQVPKFRLVMEKQRKIFYPVNFFNSGRL